MNTFLQHTAESIIAKLNWQQLSHTTLVLPSHRAGLVLKNELLKLQREQNQKAVWAPNVLTLQQLQDQLSPLYAEDELLTVVRLYRHYRQVAEGELMSLDLFYYWGRQMLADFTNIDASMHASEVNNFFDNTIAAHELSTWNLDKELEERLKSLLRGEGAPEDKTGTFVKEQYTQLWRNLHVLYDALRAEMKAEQKGYSGMRQRAVIEQWEEESIQSQIAGRTYVFVGFNYLLPVELDLMKLFKDAGQALFYWDFVPDFQTNEKAFSFTKYNSGILGNDGQSSNVQFPMSNFQCPLSNRQSATVVACSSKEAQAQYVHQWLRENYTEKGQKVGVVICDENLLESVIYTLPAITLEGQTEPEPINITKGFPLRHTDVYARVLGWLYDRKRGDAEQVVSPDFIDDLLAALLPSEEEPSNPSPITDNPSPLSWKDLLILESEYQVRKVANQLRQLLATGLGDVPFTLKLLRLLMRRVMESVTMPFHGEPVTDMQIMGVLETRLLDFDKLLLLNVEEGVIPQTNADNSFIPYYLRKSYSMQTSDERATVYAYNFFRLLSRAGHSTLLFTTTDGAENSKGMSRFIMQMLVSPEFEVTKVQLKEQGVLQPIDEARLGTSGVSFTGTWLSPSAINTYITCPRQFCFTYIQGVRGAEEEEVVFGAATLGTFVHNTMEYLYKEQLKCKSGVLTPVSPESIEQILASETIIEEALKHTFEKLQYVQAEHRPEKSIILAYVRNILQRDKEDAEVGLQMYLLEAKRTFPVELEDGTVITTGGYIDRADLYGPKGQEVLRIIDYKSGKYKPSARTLTGGIAALMEREDKGYARQTLIYSHALMLAEDEQAAEDDPKRPIVPNIYFCCHPLSGEQTGLAFTTRPYVPLTDYRSVQSDFIKALTAKLEEIHAATEFPPCEEGKCPIYCPFLTVCGRKVTTFDE